VHRRRQAEPTTDKNMGTGSGLTWGPTITSPTPTHPLRKSLKGVQQVEIAVQLWSNPRKSVPGWNPKILF